MSRIQPLQHLGGLLLWSLRHTERQKPIWRVAALYILYAGPLIYTVSRGTKGSLPPGEQLAESLRTVHVPVAFLFAASRAGETVIDRPSGLLGLVMLTNMPAGRWITYQMLSLLVSYSLLWILRLPFYAFAIGTGALWTTILHGELLQWSVFVAVAAVTLLAARFVHITIGAMMVNVVMYVLWTLAPFVPMWVISAVTFLSRLDQSPHLPDLQELAAQIAQLSPSHSS